MKKIIQGLCLFISTLCVISFVLFSCKPKRKIQLETANVTLGSIHNTVTATGTVEPVTQVEVGTQVSGIIDKIYVDYNSEVKKGQIIAELDKTVLVSELASKQADLQASKIEYEYQEKNYARSKTLYEKKLISDTDFETATYQYETAKSTYEKNTADLVKVKTNLGYATIYSPIDGIVLSKDVEEGQTVASSFSTPTLFTIANDLSKMEVVADVDEADIGQVQEGQRVTFTVDAYPNDIFQGEVIQARLEATTTSNVVTYEVVINAPNPELKLKPGLTANITIYTSERNNILTIPSKALRFVPDPLLLKNSDFEIQNNEAIISGKDKKIIWQKKDKILYPKQITIGITNGSLTEVTSGLEEGDSVVTEFLASLPIQEQEIKSEGNSPFMPKPPGSDKKK